MALVVKAVPRDTDVPAEDAAGALRWDELVALVHRQMLSLAGPSKDLEDLTQTALEQVLRAVDRFRGDAELSTFTYKVCVHVARNHWRWWRRWLTRFELAAGSGDDERGPADARPAASELTIERERIERLYACLAKLGTEKRLAITLYDLEELPAPRVAEILGCPEATVRSRLRQARRDLAALLAREPAFEDFVRRNEATEANGRPENRANAEDAEKAGDVPTAARKEGARR
jgi:RNA polymerase sigma-70 factor (ECF subfamily)